LLNEGPDAFAKKVYNLLIFSCQETEYQVFLCGRQAYGHTCIETIHWVGCKKKKIDEIDSSNLTGKACDRGTRKAYILLSNCI
jgi:hypothetical protein